MSSENRGVFRTKASIYDGASKSGGVFRTQVSIYDGAFLWIYLTAYYVCNKSFIIDVPLG